MGPLPVFGSPLNRMPAVPLEETTLLTTKAPGTSPALLSVGRLRATPGWGALLTASRVPASMLMPYVAALEMMLASMTNWPCSRGRLESPRRAPLAA